jgi:glycosyltransferase involved in cell wall biosynthesis
VAHLQYEHGFFRVNDAPAENFDALIREVRVPKVITLHSMPLEDPRWQRHLQDESITFVVHSRQHVEALRARGARNCVDAAPHPATPRLAPSVSGATYRTALGLDGRLIMTIFGFTKLHKGYHLVLEALPRLPEAATLLIAGGAQDEWDGHVLWDVERRARESGLASRVRVTGYVPPSEVGAAMEISDVVLAPFNFMTSSGSLATALAWARPIVAADLDQNVELAAAFHCVHLFKTGDAGDLARQITRVLSDADLRNALILGAETFRRQCSYERLAKTTVELYRRLLQGTRSAAPLGRRSGAA